VVKKKSGELAIPAKASAEPPELEYQGTKIRSDAEGFICLTDMWRAEGSPANKEPQAWSRFTGKEFIAHMARRLNTGKSRIYKTLRGKGVGGTFAHFQIGLSYAQYLSNEFHEYVNSVFVEWKKEEAEPGLKMDRARQGYARKGMAVTWVNARQLGKDQRKEFVTTVFDHNGDGETVAAGTRAISMRIVGKTPKELRLSRDVPKSGQTRDHMSEIELTRTRYAEFEATIAMRERGSDGHAECLEACRDAADVVAAGVKVLRDRNTGTTRLGHTTR